MAIKVSHLIKIARGVRARRAGLIDNLLVRAGLKEPPRRGLPPGLAPALGAGALGVGGLGAAGALGYSQLPEGMQQLLMDSLAGGGAIPENQADEMGALSRAGARMGKVDNMFDLSYGGGLPGGVHPAEATGADFEGPLGTPGQQGASGIPGDITSIGQLGEPPLPTGGPRWER